MTNVTAQLQITEDTWRSRTFLISFYVIPRIAPLGPRGLSETSSLPPRGSGKDYIHSTLLRLHLVRLNSKSTTTRVESMEEGIINTNQEQEQQAPNHQF